MSVTGQVDPGSRPDLAAPIYGVLWEEFPPPENAPPLFLADADDNALGDLVVTPNLTLYAAWRAVGTPVELHVQGGYGFGMRQQNLPGAGWIDWFHEWMHAQRLLSRSERP